MNNREKEKKFNLKKAREILFHIPPLLTLPLSFLFLFIIYTSSCSKMKYEEIVDVEKKLGSIKEDAERYVKNEYQKVAQMLEKAKALYARGQKLKAKDIINKINQEINEIEKKIEEKKKVKILQQEPEKRSFEEETTSPQY